jgi:hypothetical protein
MYTYFLIPALLVIAVAFKYHKKEESPTPEQQLDVQKCIKKAELYADFNPELFKEFINASSFLSIKLITDVKVFIFVVENKLCCCYN